MSILQSVLTLLPILWLIVALAVLKIPGHKACLVALVIAAALALTLWHMPVVDCVTSALEGFAAALWPIILVIIAAIFTYNLSLRTGAMDVIKRLLTNVSSDQRVLILLIGWCFGGFLEGMAGFGTAIAIPASMLAGMGMNPITACLVCMLANAFPTAFGSVGIPTVTLSNVTSLDALPLAFMTVVQMIPFMILVPFLMVMAGSGGPKALKGVVGITLVSGLSFVLPELLVAKFLGAELPVIVGSVISLACTLLMARARKNKAVEPAYSMQSGPSSAAKDSMSPGVAFLPFILIFVLLLLFTSKLVAPVNTFLATFSSSFQISTSATASTTSFSWINTPGILIFIAAIIGGIVQKASAKVMWETLCATVKQMVKTIITIMSVLAVAKIYDLLGHDLGYGQPVRHDHRPFLRICRTDHRSNRRIRHRQRHQHRGSAGPSAVRGRDRDRRISLLAGSGQLGRRRHRQDPVPAVYRNGGRRSRPDRTGQQGPERCAQVGAAHAGHRLPAHRPSAGDCGNLGLIARTT